MGMSSDTFIPDEHLPSNVIVLETCERQRGTLAVENDLMGTKSELVPFRLAV